MSQETIRLGITEISDRIRRQDLSPVELLELCLSRIHQTNGRLNAFVIVSEDSARRAAKEVEKEIRSGRYKGPLHGVPIGIKDMIDTSGIATAYGSAIFKGNMPHTDATVVRRLKEAGAIVLGKTNTHEFALGVTTDNLHYGATRNPWSLDRVPGGSSGGSAAAVAADMCFASVGTDTGGSIRIPSAFCGLVGLKPTYGMVSTKGVFPLALSMDHVGPIARSVVDAAIMLQAMAGFDEADPRTIMNPVPDFLRDIEQPDMADSTITVLPAAGLEVIDPDVESAYKNALSKVESLGGEVLERDLKTSRSVEQVSSKLLLAEAAFQHSELLKEHSDKYGANVINRFRAGQNITVTQYIEALRECEAVRREIELLFEEADFLLTPSVQILPPKLGEEKVRIGSSEVDIISGCVRFTRLANITGIPAIVIPYGYSGEGLPLSIQIMAPKQRETHLFSFAHNLEKATPELRDRYPPHPQ